VEVSPVASDPLLVVLPFAQTLHGLGPIIVGQQLGVLHPVVLDQHAGGRQVAHTHV